MRISDTRLLAALCGTMVTAAAFGGIGPYTETFSSSAALWSSSSVFAALNYLPAGGPDGSGYGNVSASFANNVDGDFAIMFRGQSNFGSSGNNFFGNWTGAGLNLFSFSVRQNTTHPVTYFARFTSGAAPGVVALMSPGAVSGEWTTYSVVINPLTPFIYEGSPALYSTFSNVQRVQVGVIVDAALAGQAGPFDFDIDNVSTVPSPAGAAALLAGMGLFGARRRRA